MRKPRYYYESNFYHIMVQGDEKKYIFQSYKNKEKYLYYLRHNAFRNDVEIVAYCIKYIHNNPVKAKVCEKPEEYYYSSYKDLKKYDERLKEITDISEEEIEEILNNSDTITRFLDDEYSKEDNDKVFEELKNKYNYSKEDNISIGQMYLKLKEHCRISDTEIANLLNMKRTTMNTKLKKLGLKSGVM